METSVRKLLSQMEGQETAGGEQEQVGSPAASQLLPAWPQRAWDLFSRLRSRSPLIQCITNLVSMDITANVLLAAGASPAMVHSIREIEDFTPRVGGLCINIGTLTEDWLPSMTSAAFVARRSAIPWVLDPVAVSASEFRMKACLDLVNLRPTVIRGNASEIIALSAASRLEISKGADSSHESTEAVELAKSLATNTGSIVAVSGSVDYITDGIRVVGVQNGVPMLQKITATGCAVTALITAFVAVDPSHPLEATACALSVFCLAGEVGMESATGPGSLRVGLMDALHLLEEKTVTSRVSIVDLA